MVELEIVDLVWQKGLIEQKECTALFILFPPDALDMTK
jgi:hypothetical protein